ncbi:hypothetical protein [Daejeonella oryzae]|uniref:hypothetical protein n=1 Tax=Daejeonella oryzae TaxID=1122943 RepID=UPI0004788C92|nr:hypothetical protein [Daejeonella oryzae]
MNPVSIIFFVIFVIPLIALLIYVMKQDKRKGIIGLIVLGVIVTAAIVVALTVYSNFLKTQ